MSQNSKGKFAVAELTDGRFVAASCGSPYFCFRAETEKAVIEKVQRALTFYGKSEGIGAAVNIKSVTQTVTTLRPIKTVGFEEVAEVEAA